MLIPTYVTRFGVQYFRPSCEQQSYPRPDCGFFVQTTSVESLFSVTLLRGGAVTLHAAAERSVDVSAAKHAAPVAATKDTSISTDMSDRLSLDNIRASLIRQEDSIIFSLIERAQYRLNSPVYQAGGVDVPCFHPDGQRASMLEYMLREFEQTGGGAGCHTYGLSTLEYYLQLSSHSQRSIAGFP